MYPRTYSFSVVTVTGGTINGTVIGGTTPAAITGTTITATTGFSGPLNGTVGAVTPAAGSFTTLAASGKVSLGAAPLTTHAINIDSATFGDAFLSLTNAGNTVTLAQRSGGHGMTLADTASALTLSIFRNQVAGATGGVGELEWEYLTSLGASWDPAVISVYSRSDVLASKSSEMLFKLWANGAASYPMHIHPGDQELVRYYNPAATYPSANWEALSVQWNSNIARLFTSKAGSGTVRELQFGSSTNSWGIKTTGEFYPTGAANTQDLATVAQPIRNAYIGTRLVVGNATSEAGYLWLRTDAGVNALNVSDAGNVNVGGAAVRATTEGNRAVNIFDGTAPVGTLANGVSIYSTAGECYIMDAAGNATLQSPHDSVTNEWIFRSTHTPTGRKMTIRMEEIVRRLVDKYGWDDVMEVVSA